MSQDQSWFGAVARSSWPGIGGVAQPLPPLPALALCREDAVHRALRGEVGALVEQRGIDLCGGVVHEARVVELREDGGPLVIRQGQDRLGTRRPSRLLPGVAMAVGGGAADPQGPAGGSHADLGCHPESGVDQDPLSSSSRSRADGMPRSAETFDWIDDALGGREALLEPGVVPREALVLLGQGVRPGATGRTGQRFERTAVAGPAPVDEVARVEPLAAQDGTDATGLGGVDLGEDGELVLGAEATAHGTLGDLGVGHRVSMHLPVHRGRGVRHGEPPVPRPLLRCGSGAGVSPHAGR
jgi:hypothetical protein